MSTRCIVSLSLHSITIFQPQVYLATAIAHRVPLFITILINSLALMSRRIEQITLDRVTKWPYAGADGAATVAR